MGTGLCAPVLPDGLFQLRTGDLFLRPAASPPIYPLVQSLLNFHGLSPPLDLSSVSILPSLCSVLPIYLYTHHPIPFSFISS